jgi:hypothetical protein
MTNAAQLRRAGPPTLQGAVPPALRPALRAFLFGYASAVGPRLFSLLVRYAKSKHGRRGKEGGKEEEEEAREVRVVEGLRAVLASGLGWTRFPAFCALLVGGSTFLEVGCVQLDGKAWLFPLPFPSCLLITYIATQTSCIVCGASVCFSTVSVLYR